MKVLSVILIAFGAFFILCAVLVIFNPTQIASGGFILLLLLGIWLLRYGIRTLKKQNAGKDDIPLDQV